MTDNAQVPPNRPQMRTVTPLTVMMIIILPAIGACTSCWDEKADSPSPDSRYVAHREAHFCQGPWGPNLSAAAFIEIVPAGSYRRGIKIFESEGSGAEMHWVDSNELSLQVGSKLPISLSLHEANGIRITYHVPEKLMAPTGTAWLERQAEQLRRIGKLNDDEYEKLKASNQPFQQLEEDFIRWASENAVIEKEK
jgi:hypothetical protein